MNFEYIKQVIYKTSLLVTLIAITAGFWFTAANAAEIKKPVGFDLIGEQCLPLGEGTVEGNVKVMFTVNEDSIRNEVITIDEVLDQGEEVVVHLTINKDGNKIISIINKVGVCNYYFTKGTTS